MSQSPLAESQNKGSVDYASGWEAIYQMLARGQNWSGNERNCCFLNLGTQRFANVSAVTGLDHLDDGRAVAMVDWDLDGDQDIWITNRTSPAIRFLRNDIANGNHFLAIRLVGKTCNRDAIGAKAELQLANEGSGKRTKSVRAGEAYLAQSSKWLHFGLGEQGVPQSLTVYWPGGQAETFTELEADAWYEIVQGSGKAMPWKSPRTKMTQLAESIQTIPPSTGRARIVVVQDPRPQFSNLVYQDAEGKNISIDNSHRGPVLLTLWSRWCSTCVDELKLFAEQQRKLNRNNLQVVAVNVDQFEDADNLDTTKIQRFLTSIRFPYRWGFLGQALAGELEKQMEDATGKIEPLSIPTSFLLDDRRRLVAIYRGPVEIDQLLADLKLIDASRDEIVEAAIPFSGRWLSGEAEKFQPKPIFSLIVRELLTNPIYLVPAAILLGLIILWFVYRRKLRKKTGNLPE